MKKIFQLKSVLFHAFFKIHYLNVLTVLEEVKVVPGILSFSRSPTSSLGEKLGYREKN